MKLRHIAILLLFMLVSGCGVFTHKQQTYYVHDVNPKEDIQVTPELAVQIVPTEKNFHILFLVQSRKWIAPYSIRFSAHSKKPTNTHFLIHSFKLKSGAELIAEEQFSTPLSLELKERKSGNFVYHELDYRYELGEALQYEKGKEIELEVIYEQSEQAEKKTIRLKGIGEEKENKSSLWNAYMSV